MAERAEPARERAPSAAPAAGAPGTLGDLLALGGPGTPGVVLAAQERVGNRATMQWLHGAAGDDDEPGSSGTPR